MTARRAHRPSKSRVVFYGWHKPTADGYLAQDIFDESAMERLLLAAREAGTVTQYDTGRSAIVWFEGTPGPAMRRLKAAVVAMLADGCVPIAQTAGRPP